MTVFSCWVPGKPVTQGSKKAFAFKGKGGKWAARTVDDKKDPLLAWRAQVAGVVAHAWGLERGPVPVAVKLTLVFHLPRPNNHYGTGKNAGRLKPWAVAARHTTKPDREKLARAVCDALSNVLWADDAQVDSGTTDKVYANDGRVGVEILMEYETP